MLAEVSVVHTFQEHATVIACLAFPDQVQLLRAWALPALIPWELLSDPSSFTTATCALPSPQGDTTDWFASFSSKYETAISAEWPRQHVHQGVNDEFANMS